MRKIKYIDIVFENCECYRVPANCMKLSLSGITKGMIINGFQYRDGEIYDYLSVKEVIINIKDSPDIINQSGFDDNKSCTDRICRYSDITHIDVIYEDDTNEYYCVPWNHEDGQSNSYQKEEWEEWGSKKYLVVTIEKQ